MAEGRSLRAAAVFRKGGGVCGSSSLEATDL